MTTTVSTQTAWEYKIVRLEIMDFDEDEFKNAEANLNQLGVDGWEVVSVLRYTTEDKFNLPFFPVLMKRPKRD